MLFGRSRASRRARTLKKLAATGKQYAPLPAVETPLAGPLEVVDAFLRAWNAKEGHAVGELFADDADYINVVGLWWTSRRSIGRTFSRAFANEFAEATLTFERLAFRQVGGDGAVLHARYKLAGQVDPEGEPVDERRGVLTCMLERTPAEGWLIVSAQATDIQVATDTLLARDGELKAISYVPVVPDLPESDEL